MAPEADRLVRVAHADRWSRAAAVLVLALGLVVVVVPALWHGGSLFDDPYVVPQTEVRELVTRADGSTTTTVTAREAERSLVERALGVSGLVLLRLGVVALAAFLAGAVVQRTLLANFALKLGPLEVPDIARTTESALEKIEEQLNRQADATEDALRAGASAVEAVAALTQELDGLKILVAAAIPDEAADAT